MGVLLEVILLVFLVGGGGILIGRLSRLDSRLLTRIIFCLLGPALSFRLLYASTIPGEDVLRIAAFVVIHRIRLLIASRILGRVLGWEGDTRGGVTGDDVRQRRNLRPRGVAVRIRRGGRVERVPWLVAFLLALLFRATGWVVPVGVYRGVDLLASPTIPMQWVVLGIQLARVRFAGFPRRPSG